MFGRLARLLTWPAVSCVMGASAIMPAVAQEAARSEAGGWSFHISPYVWAANIEGEVRTIRGTPKADVDADFGDIVDNLNFGAMTILEARRNRFGVKADLIYLDLESYEDVAIPPFSRVNAEFSTFIGTFVGSYRPIAEGDSWLDLLAGARLWVTDTEVTLESNIIGNITGDEKEVWADPIVGLRARYDLGSGFGLRGYGDIGGFGAASDLTFQAYGALEYHFKEWWSAEVGYRVIDVDYHDDGFVYDVTTHGPTIGMRFRF